MVINILRGIGIISGEATLPFSFLILFSVGVNFKEIICSSRSRFCPLREDPILKGIFIQGSKEEVINKSHHCNGRH